MADIGAELNQAKQQLAAAGIVVTEKQFLRAVEIGMTIYGLLCFAARKPVNSIDDLPVSSGYQPLFVENGWNSMAARAAAAIAVRHGRRRAAESKRIRPVCDAIRFLARPGRRRNATRRHTELLLRAWDETSIIETIFDAAGISEQQFLNLLRAFVDGDDGGLPQICTIAVQLLPYLSVVRGPKVSAPSAALEFILENSPDMQEMRSQRARSRGNEHVDALTLATRREFENFSFDSRSARRRLKRRSANKPPADAH